MKLSGREDRTETNSRASIRPQDVNVPRTSLLAIALGIVAGAVAVAFRDALVLLPNLIFSGGLGLTPADGVRTPVLILIPVLGSFAVTFLVRR
jgi:hypothetical protein